MYLPVIVQWLLLSIRYRSLTLPLLANPSLPLSGMAGVPKSELFNQAKGECRKAILPWIAVQVTDAPVEKQVKDLLKGIDNNGVNFPFVCKPDIGCRGSGVKLVHNVRQLTDYIDAYPPETSLICQKLSRWEPEAGVFFVKHPDQAMGKIISLALKYTPYVVGDGKHTLRQLIESDQRAGQLSHLYLRRHRAQLATVIEKGEPYRLLFSASHCRGAIFTDGRHLITPELTRRIDQIMGDLPEFYYGRLDIKFPTVESLQKGERLEVVEINSASSESLHIWDKDVTLIEAVQALLFQYKTLFLLGNQNRERGFKTPGVRALLAGWKKERHLDAFYPATD
jgi:hypothetical protein